MRVMGMESRGSILITGGARRIGAAMARRLARDGWFVCVHHNASKDDAEILLAEIVESGGAGKLISGR